jgi:hypothetical protein
MVSLDPRLRLFFMEGGGVIVSGVPSVSRLFSPEIELGTSDSV